MGYRCNKFVALSVLRTDCGAPGTALEVEVFGERRPAIVTGDDAAWDPQNERLRA
jgi:dimethylglycine dehydrogenase